MATGYYLLDHPNPGGPFFYDNRLPCRHGIPTAQLPHLIVVHTAESLPDYYDEDTSAEAVARYATTTRRSVSWHSTVDSDSDIPMLPDHFTGFHVIDYNRCAVGVELATQAHRWVELATNYPAWYDAIMGKAANRVAWWCKVHNIPVLRLTKAQASGRGIIGHHELDPDRRSDPGEAFAWERFLAEVNARLAPGGYVDRDDWPAWAATSIDKAIAAGVMVGDGTLWTPDKPVTRAELALILDRLGLL
jgi:hypothetical protein